MKAWLDLHGRAKVLATDHWYLEFANLLLPVVSESYLYKSETQESQNQVTLMLTLYLEDCVTDGGNWRQFIRWHKRNYGRYLPFYELSEGYLTDEINKEDIAFLLWGINSPVGDDFDGVENPLDADLLECFACCLAGRSVARECGALSESEWWRAVDVLRFV